MRRKLLPDSMLIGNFSNFPLVEDYGSCTLHEWVCLYNDYFFLTNVPNFVDYQIFTPLRFCTYWPFYALLPLVYVHVWAYTSVLCSMLVLTLLYWCYIATPVFHFIMVAELNFAPLFHAERFWQLARPIIMRLQCTCMQLHWLIIKEPHSNHSCALCCTSWHLQ